MKSNVLQWLGIGVSLVFIVVLLRSLELGHIQQILLNAEYWWLLPAIAASLLSFVFRGERFRMLLASFQPFSLARSYQYIAVNYMANNILPARAGEFLLSYVVKKMERIPVSSSLAVTVLGRVMDGMLLLSGLIITLLLLPFPGWVTRVALLGCIVFGLAFGVLMWLIFAGADHQSAVRDRLKQQLPVALSGITDRLLVWANQFRAGLLPIRSRRVSILAVVLSISIWLCEGLVYWFTGQVFGLSFNLLQLLFILSLANLATSIPSGPAGIGTFEGVVIIGLGLLGVSSSLAAAYALILHATQVLPITAIGAVSYLRLTLRQGVGLKLTAKAQLDS